VARLRWAPNRLTVAPKANGDLGWLVTMDSIECPNIVTASFDGAGYAELMKLIKRYRTQCVLTADQVRELTAADSGTP
jgi:hypothetical protein